MRRGWKSRRPKSILDFYPEFHHLRTKLHTMDIPPRYSKYVSIPRETDFDFLLVLHDTVVVGLEPIPESEFHDWYGVSVGQLIELAEREQVVIRISSPLERYKDLDYLDPILEKKPPTSVRADAFCEALVQDENALKSYESECDQVFNEIGLTRELLSKVGLKGIDLLASLKENFVRLRVLGFGWKLDQIRRTSTGPEAYYKELRRQYIASASQQFRSLDGDVAVPLSELTTSLRGTESLPFDAAKILLDKVELPKPKDLDEAIRLHEDFTAFRRAMMRMRETFNRDALTQASEDEVRVELEVAKKEVVMMHGRSTTRTSRLGWFLFGVSIAVGVPFGLSGAIAGAGVGLLQQRGLNIDERIARRVTRLGKPSYIAGLFELYEDQRPWKHVPKSRYFPER